MTKPKILLFDIETAPIVAHVWGLWDNNVGLNQIVKDTHMLSWSAKWLDDPESKIMYLDQRKSKRIEDDKLLVSKLKKLIDEADILVTHNGRSFDEKVVNTRLIVNGLKPLPVTKHIDTYIIAKNKFRLTSNKLEYIAKFLKVKYQKLVKRKFPGHELWTECLKGNLIAWNEMKRYNIRDTMVLQEVYLKLRPWNTAFNPLVYSDVNKCECGSQEFEKNGFTASSSGIKQRYRCKQCGKSYKGKENLLKPDRRKSILGV